MRQELLLTRDNLKEWLASDAVYYSSQQQVWWKRLKYNLLAHPAMDQSLTWKYVKHLRHAEYHSNNSGFIHKIGRTWHMFRLRRLGYKTGFQIPVNVVGPGLNLPHYGSIIVNDNCSIGRDVTLYSGVCIGWKRRGTPCPVIGDNVFIGIGSSVIGDVRVGNHVTIGQNCVIVKDIADESTVVAQPPRILNK